MYKYHLTLTLAIFACFAATTPGAMAQNYSVKDIGSLDDKKMSHATALNNQEQVVGTSSSNDDDREAFLYFNPKGQMEALGESTPLSVTRAFGINEAGVAVGDSSFGGTAYRPFGPSAYIHAALFENNSSVDLGSFIAGQYSRANGINASRQVVGFCSAKLDSTNGRAFLWSSDTGMIDIGTLGGEFAQAFAINDAGFVTGNSQTASGTLGSVHAFLYGYAPKSLANSMQDLGTLGGDSSYGISINVQNHVAGYSVNGEGRIHAFLYAHGKMQDLGSLGGKSPQSDQSFALSVNNADRVVGYTYLPVEEAGPLAQAQSVAFVYQNGVMTDLNEMIGSAAKTYQLTAATAVNDKGQITASAYNRDSQSYRAVLLTPRLTDPAERPLRTVRKR